MLRINIVFGNWLLWSDIKSMAQTFYFHTLQISVFLIFQLYPYDYILLTKNCTDFLSKRGYFNETTSTEKGFPLAFRWVAYVFLILVPIFVADYLSITSSQKRKSPQGDILGILSGRWSLPFSDASYRYIPKSRRLTCHQLNWFLLVLSWIFF